MEPMTVLNWAIDGLLALLLLWLAARAWQVPS